MKHGLHKHKLYYVWDNMKQRCYNKSNPAYCNYGNRGIVVHDNWLDNFKAFYDFAVNEGWKEGLELDRINNDGNYEPDNCRFVTHSKNQFNKRPHGNSGIKNVYKNGKNYMVRKCINGDSKYFGTFNTLEEATKIAQELNDV